MGPFTFKIGADPEVFLRDASGKFVSGHDLIPGTKEEPFFVPDGAIQRDGVALEFNIAPATSSVEFIHNINSVMKSLHGHYSAVRPDCEFAIEPTAFFDKDYFDGLPEEPKILGCTPDFNAYTGLENSPPHTDEPFRTGAGHIHIGWGSGFSISNPDHFDLCRDVVKQLDCILYPASLLWDRDYKRRSLYGRLGAFRPKKYGVEYRPLSNAILKAQFIQKFVFDATVHAVDLLMNGDINFMNVAVCENMVKYLYEGNVPEAEDIADYLFYMNEEYGCPNVIDYSVEDDGIEDFSVMEVDVFDQVVRVA